jgi:hypothetical protein
MSQTEFQISTRSPQPVALPDVAAAPISYSDRLTNDPRWALIEGSKYFEEKSAVWEALRKIGKRLSELGIPYAVAGGIALFRHGYRRFTEDLDIVVAKKDLKQIHKELEGRGYLPPFARSKNLRDTELGVKIEFLITGEFPGDGKPKPVSFPDPDGVTFEHDGVRFVNLQTLVELKLASGMTGSDRQKDLIDVQELIKVLNLSKEFAGQLNPFVREKYGELWAAARPAGKRYIDLWRNKFLTVDAKSLDEMIDQLAGAVEQLKAMRDDGVLLDPEGGTADDYAHLVTTDPDVAKKYGMIEESEFWGEDLDEEEGDAGQKPKPPTKPPEAGAP